MLVALPSYDAAARALADVVTAGELGPNYIIPSVFHPDVASAVAAAVREAASVAQSPGAQSSGPHVPGAQPPGSYETVNDRR